MREEGPSTQADEKTSGGKIGWDELNDMIRKARPANKMFHWWSNRFCLAGVVLSAVIVVLLLTHPSISLMKTPRPSGQLLMATYQATFAVTVATASIIIAVFVFADRNARTSYEMLTQMIEKNLKDKFGCLIEIDDEKDQLIWIDLWRRLEQGPELGDTIPYHEWKVPLQRTASLVGRSVYLNEILVSLPMKTLSVMIPFAIVAAWSIVALSTLDPDIQQIRFEGVHLYVVLGMVLAYGYFAVYSKITVGGLWKMSRRDFIKKAALRGKKVDEEPDRISPDEVSRRIDEAQSKLVRLQSIESQSQGRRKIER